MSFIKSLASYYRKQHLHNGIQPRAFIVPRRCEIATEPKMDSNGAGKDSEPSLPPHPTPRFPYFTWAKWVLSSILAIALPFFDKKWRSLLRLEGEVEMAAEVVEHAAEAVEKVATVAEKMAADAAQNMPEDAKLKSAAIFVENVSKEVAEEAHLTVDVIHKVEELKEEVEMLIDPIEEIEKLVDRHKKP